MSTYAIAKAARALFLNEIIDFEKQEQIEIAKAKLILNMALVDGNFSHDDLMNATTLLSGMAQLAKADGTLYPAEKLYLQTLGHELGYTDDALKLLVE